jgi:shikimate kinase
MRRNIVLAGFMGVGKSAVGRIVAERLGLRFVDTDDLIAAEAGQSIAAIFENNGEPTFRRIEAEVCQRVAAQGGQVIASGGGALLDPAIRAAFEASGLVVCLCADLDAIIQRVGVDPSRPLFANKHGQLTRLLAARAALYDSLPHQIDTTHLSPERVAEEIISLWKQHA